MSSKIEIDRIVRSKRKSIALEINKTGELIVRAPHSTTLDYLKKLVLHKKEWILDKQNTVIQKIEKSRKEYRFGGKFYFLGKKYEIIPSNDNENIIYFQNNFFINVKYESYIKDLIVKWYKLHADKIIKDRVIGLADDFNLDFKKIMITSAEKRWGSCSSRKHLNFSWRLIMAPIEIIDYVVVHELAHLKELNHSSRFWDLVGSMLPEYKKCKKWLRNNSFKFYLD
ncbi:MAG TPA: SprT family zinc-dependent metalloprotease [Victivallales bacterium]|nr:SprT family zinc-dependent metalloprotease [Victivallales bacterium]